MMQILVEDDNHVIDGPTPVNGIPNDSLGNIYLDILSDKSTYNNVAMVDAVSGQTITYGSLLEQACTLAETFRKCGYDDNTIIAISSENNLSFYVPVLAAFLAGITVAPVNQFYTPGELKHVLNITKPKIIFVSSNIASKFVQLKTELTFIDKVILLNNEEAVLGTQSTNEFIQDMLGDRKVSPHNFVPWNGDVTEKLAFILSSSGTTGLPKAVMITHKNFNVRIAQTREPLYMPLDKVTVLGLLPFFHTYGFGTGLTSLINKNKIILLKRFQEDIFLQTLEKYKIDAIHIAPPLAVFLAKTPKLEKYDLSRIVQVNCGAAPLSKEIDDMLRKRLNLEAINQGYGMTEVVMAILRTKNGVVKMGSCGIVMPFCKVKIRDPETGRSLGPQQVGEICCKSPLVMKGYYNNEKSTKESFTSDGWYRTGDLAYYDENKFFYIVDRLKELIKYKGFQVAPAELEALIISHPKVLDVGVVGLPDELAGELPVAFIVKRTEDLSQQEILEFVNKQVSPQKRLRGGVIFVSSIPKNPSGKILRRELRKQLVDYKPPVESKL